MPDFDALLSFPPEELKHEFKVREQIALGGNKDELTPQLSEHFKDFNTRTLYKAIQTNEPEATVGDGVDLSNMTKPPQGLPRLGVEPLSKHADVVALICPANYLHKVNDTISTLDVRRVAGEQGLCGNALITPNQKNFINQPANKDFRTGVLVKNDIVLTSGHCVARNQASSLRVVFGYQMNSDDTWPGSSNPNVPVYRFEIENQNIFSCQEIDRGDDSLLDWVLLKLDPNPNNPINRTPPEFSTSSPANGNDVYTLGYPLGLPLKSANNGKVINSNLSIFKASLDIYGGDSGSPVFNKEDKLEGLVLKAEYEFKSDPSRNNCQMLVRLRDNGLHGSDCISITAVRSRFL